MQFDSYEDLAGRWRWRLSTDDGNPVATSGESFETHWHALRAAERVRRAAAAARISGPPGSAAADPLQALLDRELARGG